MITIYGSGFSPKSTTITEGDTVTWKNKDNSNHQVLADKGQFVSPIIRPNQTFSFTFRASGTYTYKDELHPKLTGTIVVKGLPPTLTFARLGADRHLRRQGDAQRHRLEARGRRVGDDLLPAVSAAEPDPARDRADRGRRHVQLHRRPADPDELPGRLEGRVRDADHDPGAPKLSLGRNNGWVIHASAGHSFAGKAVQFQRLNPPPASG